MKRMQLVLLLAAGIAAAPAALAYDAGDYIFRVGATMVAPDDSSSNVFVDGVDQGVGVNVDNDTQVGLNFAWFLTERWSLELLAATPFTHDFDLETVGPLGKLKHLPPTLTANYYFADPSSTFQPYAGAGLNYTIIYDEEFTAANVAAGFSNPDADNSFGLSAQVGVDLIMNDKWHVNASVRWIDIDTDAEFLLNGDRGTVSVSIDPWVYTIAVGYTF